MKVATYQFLSIGIEWRLYVTYREGCISFFVRSLLLMVTLKEMIIRNFLGIIYDYSNLVSK
jgi:hypothetical protein